MGSKKRNEYIREVAAANGVSLWEIAEVIGISDSAFSKRLRKELNEKEREQVLQIIMTLANEEG